MTGGSWTKLGAEFDALTDRLSDTAYRLLLASWQFSNSQLLDGRIPARDLGLFARNVRGDVETAIAELIDDGWWQETEVAGRPGWLVLVKCGRWQRTRDQVLADQEVDVTWTRTGGSEECGGPTFGSLTLEI